MKGEHLKFSFVISSCWKLDPCRLIPNFTVSSPHPRDITLSHLLYHQELSFSLVRFISALWNVKPNFNLYFKYFYKVFVFRLSLHPWTQGKNKSWEKKWSRWIWRNLLSCSPCARRTKMDKGRVKEGYFKSRLTRSNLRKITEGLPRGKLRNCHVVFTLIWHHKTHESLLHTRGSLERVRIVDVRQPLAESTYHSFWLPRRHVQ